MGGRATHWGVTGSTGLSGRWLLVRPGLRRRGSVERHPPATLGNPGGQGGCPEFFTPLSQTAAGFWAFPSETEAGLGVLVVSRHGVDEEGLVRVPTSCFRWGMASV